VSADKYIKCDILKLNYYLNAILITDLSQSEYFDK